MARTTAQIKQQIYDQIAATPSIAVLANNPSQVKIWGLFVNCVAVCIAVFEQLLDVYKVEYESKIQKAPPGSDFWVHQRVLEFQYDSVTPQVLALDPITMSVYYPVVDETKRIITRCSVKTTGARIASVKVATGEPPAALSAPQISALQNYLTAGGDGTYNGRGVGIGFAGAQLKVISRAPDKFYLKAEIKYDGQYAATISATVIAAIKDYYANITFDGDFKLLTLIDYIQAVPGVIDIIIEDAAIRADNIIFANKTYMIQNFTEAYSVYPVYAGYVVEETTVGEDLATRLTFTASA